MTNENFLIFCVTNRFQSVLIGSFHITISETN
jgi:hypothetical protein